jgi:hypothetical protein
LRCQIIGNIIDLLPIICYINCMNTASKNDGFILNFKGVKTFSTDDVYRFYRNNRPDIKRATVNWRIYELAQQGVIKRIGRGVYTLGNEKKFFLSPNKKIKAINGLLKKQFPLISPCIWRVSCLKEFYQHIALIDFALVEIEQGAMEPVFHFLKENYRNVFREPSKKIFEDFVSELTDVIIVKALITESPLQVCNGISMPALEKMLVDLYTEKELFYFIQGSEFLNIFKSAAEKYTINSDKLLRYANRRGKKEDIRKILNQINGNKWE